MFTRIILHPSGRRSRCSKVRCSWTPTRLCPFSFFFLWKIKKVMRKESHSWELTETPAKLKSLGALDYKKSCAILGTRSFDRDPRRPERRLMNYATQLRWSLRQKASIEFDSSKRATFTFTYRGLLDLSGSKRFELQERSGPLWAFPAKLPLSILRWPMLQNMYDNKANYLNPRSRTDDGAE